MDDSRRLSKPPDFASATFGYQRTQVNVFVARALREMESLREQLRIAEVKADRRGTELAEIRLNLDLLVEEANLARRTIIEEATRDASAIRSNGERLARAAERGDSAKLAAEIVAEAEAKAALQVEGIENIRKAAELESAHILHLAKESADRTRAEAAHTLEEARRHQSDMRNRTQLVEAKVETELAEIRRILETARSQDVVSDDLMVDLTDRVEVVEP